MPESPHELFLRAHSVLNPAVGELLASGVPKTTVLDLYPFALADWAPTITATLNGLLSGSAGYMTHARMGGVEEATRHLPAHPSKEWRVRQQATCEAFIATPSGQALLLALRGGEVKAGVIGLAVGTVVASHEVFAIAADWPALPYLHPYARAYANLLEAALAAVLPTHFPVWPER